MPSLAEVQRAFPSLTDTEAQLLVDGSWDLSPDHLPSVLANASMDPLRIILLYLCAQNQRLLERTRSVCAVL
jgi:hypothetical protein